MKIRSFGKKSGVARPNTRFVYKKCKMVFHTKDSLELHKRKVVALYGLIYFGKHEK